MFAIHLPNLYCVFSRFEITKKLKQQQKIERLSKGKKAGKDKGSDDEAEEGQVREYLPICCQL